MTQHVSITDVLRRDSQTAKKEFGEEFPLLCAQLGASIIPQVMAIHPDTRKAEPLPLNENATTNENEDSAEPKSYIAKLHQSYMNTDITEIVPHNLYPYMKNARHPSAAPYIVAHFEDNMTQSNLQKIVMKGYPVDKAFISALGMCLKRYPTLNTLHLLDCQLSAKQLELLVGYLCKTPIISDLNLEGNAIPEQNYHLLISEDTRLRCLSLRRCCIDDVGAQKISDVLRYRFPPYEHTLEVLDLSDNHLGDIGLENIASALRTNRTILELKLARNKVGDTGATALAETIQKFPLNNEEWKQKLSGNCKSSVAKKAKTSVDLESSNPSSKNPNTYCMMWNIFPQQVDEKNAVEKQRKRKRTKNAWISYQHPYVWDARPEGLDLWCIGNFNIEHIDLDNNCIGEKGARRFVTALEYQAMFKETEGKGRGGIKTLSLEGNPIPRMRSELDKLDEILTIPLRKKQTPGPSHYLTKHLKTGPPPRSHATTDTYLGKGSDMSADRSGRFGNRTSRTPPRRHHRSIDDSVPSNLNDSCASQNI